MIVGGLKSSTSRRRYRKDSREVKPIHTKPSQPMRWSEQPITFSGADHGVHIPDPSSFPLVADPIVEGALVAQTLIDSGSGLRSPYSIGTTAQTPRPPRPHGFRLVTGSPPSPASSTAAGWSSHSSAPPWTELVLLCAMPGCLTCAPSRHCHRTWRGRSYRLRTAARPLGPAWTAARPPWPAPPKPTATCALLN
jgi:hypothetical protein